MFSGDTYNSYFSGLFNRIIINNFTGTLMTGEDDMLCVKSGDMIDCNIDPSRLGSGTTGNSITISGSQNKYCYKVNNTTIKCDLDSGTLATLQDLEGLSGNFYTHITNLTEIINRLDGGNFTGDNGKRCKLSCDGGRIEQEGDGAGETDGTGCSIVCRSNAPTSYWTLMNLASSRTLNTENTAYNIKLGAGGTTNHKLDVNGTVDFKLNDVFRSGSLARFDGYGVRLFGAMALIMTKYDSTRVNGVLQSRQKTATVTGFVVNGPIAAGNPNNYIYIYADGDTGTNDRHYEIMGNNELAIGTQYGAFLYFTQKTGTYIYHLDPMEYGSSAGGASGKTGSESGGKGTSSSSSQGGDYQELQQGDYVAAYQSFMVGVNTNQPNATLDVYGSLRIGNNCVPATCDTGHAGTMMYYETDAYGGQIVVCALSSTDGAYHWFAIKMNQFEDSSGYPNNYMQTCHAPVPSPIPVPVPEPYSQTGDAYEPVL